MELNNTLNGIILGAYYEAKNQQHEYVTPEHLLYAAAYSDEGMDILENSGADVEELRLRLKEHLAEQVPRVTDGEVSQTLGFQKVLNLAITHALAAQKEEVDLGDLLVSLFKSPETTAALFLRQAGIDLYNLTSYIAHGISAGHEPLSEEAEEEAEEEEDGDLLLDEAPATDSAGASPRAKPDKERKILEAFTVNLTEMARRNELEPLIGREDILERTIQILCRRIKNNPIHVGEPGVGKTAITEGLAQLIAAGKVPDPLQKAEIYRLDMSSILAGTKYRGDFEERMKKVLAVLSQQDNAILFIDEIHTIVGAGAVSGGSLDASNMLKPILTAGRIRCIGCSTHEDFRKFLERDRALPRRFQKVEVLEPSVEETYLILKGLRKKYEEYHGITYADEALYAAAELAGKYITDRHLPDKAIDVMDEAGARARIGGRAGDTLTPEDVERVVARMARIPEQTVSTSEIGKLKSLQHHLQQQIFGQDHAIGLVVESIKRARAGFNLPDKPVASFLFVGPTGVGKTELARQLALKMGIPLLRYDMSEYQEKHTVSRLIGAPPGYVGYEEGGLLTEAVRKSPHAVLLLDEIEKAHPDIFNTLLQIMDYATLTDNTGKHTDFRNVILIMTSNAGAREIGKTRPGFQPRTVDQSALSRAVEHFFSPEFRNRLEKIVRFNGLERDIFIRIVKKNLGEFADQLHQKGITLQVTPAACRWLADQGFSREFGAREIERIVQENVKKHFVDEVLFGKLKHGGTARVFVRGKELQITTRAAGD